MLEERNQRVANSPAARLGEDVMAALYLNHPYGKPVIGWRHEIETLTREDALAFYRRFYTPDNAIVVVAGDVSAPKRSRRSPKRPTAGSSARAEIAPRAARAGAGAAHRPAGHLRRPAGQPAQPAAQLSRAVLRHAKGDEARALEVLAHILDARTQ